MRWLWLIWAVLVEWAQGVWSGLVEALWLLPTDPAAGLQALNTWLNDLVWGPPMLIFLVGVGVYITIRCRFVQFSKFGLMCKETMGKIFRRGLKAEGDITPFQAVTVAMGGTVGVGNIVGVATAIALGGPGAIFWMLVSGLVGMATKFAEVVLGLHYRSRDRGGPMMGGPMMYITRGLGRSWRWLAVMFCIFGALAGLGIGNMTQANAVAEGLTRFESLQGLAAGTAERLDGVGWLHRLAGEEGVTAVHVLRGSAGIILCIAVGLVTLGGIKRIANVAMFCVPFMCGAYILAALVVIALKAAYIPATMALIFKHAFTPAAAVGGFAGAAVKMAIRYGIARGVFSNEAGLGSAPIAHATARTDHPVRQGLWGIFEVFFDTIIMCMATALVILLSGAWESGKTGATLTMDAFAEAFGVGFSYPLVVGCMILTAYDTILAWCFYGETCASFVFGHSKWTRTIYRVVWLPFIIIGAVGGLRPIWAVSDTLNGLMAIPNLIALLLLGGVVVKLTRGFLRKEPYAPPPADGPGG